jgi:hypothetical protein
VVAFPPSPSHHPFTLTLPPLSLSVTLPTCGVGAWSPLPLTPILPPQTLSVSLEVLRWEIRTVCVGRGGRLEVRPRPLQMAVYKETQRKWVSTCLFDFPPSPTALSFILRILEWRLFSFSAFSYRAQFQYAPSPMTHSFI